MLRQRRSVTGTPAQRGLAGFVALSFFACSPGADGFTEQDLELLRGMVLESPPTDPSNEYANNAAAARLGQALFFDTELGERRPDGSKTACADCHAPKRWFSDPRTENNVSFGLGWTTRNSPSLVNVGFYKSFGWAGGADSLWGQCAHAYENPRTMAGTRWRLASRVAGRYSAEYRAAFGEELPRVEADVLDAELVYRRALKAWGAYLLQLVSKDSRFDDFARGNLEALTPPEQHGLQLFLGKAGCITCHSGPTFTDDRFHALGLQQSGPNVPAEDKGRYAGLQQLAGFAYKLKPALKPTSDDVGRFRTKSLRQIAETGPYFHAGQARTLTDVVWFYTQGGDRAGAGTPSPLMVPLGLSELEQADLVSFLETLTGAPVPATWTCDNSLTRGERPDGVTPCMGP